MFAPSYRSRSAHVHESQAVGALRVVACFLHDNVHPLCNRSGRVSPLRNQRVDDRFVADPIFANAVHRTRRVFSLLQFNAPSPTDVAFGAARSATGSNSLEDPLQQSPLENFVWLAAVNVNPDPSALRSRLAVRLLSQQILRRWISASLRVCSCSPGLRELGSNLPYR